MADIKRMLNKKNWTGRELGIIELTNTAIVFRQALEGKEPKPLVEQAKLREMINTITDHQQGQVYNGYISIHEWLSIRYNIAQTQLQSAQFQYKNLIGYITDATLAEDVYRYIEQLPAIMTQKQYDDTKAERAGTNFEAEGDISTFNGNRRAILNGIAILRASDIVNQSPRIDGSGYYVEPNITHTLSNFTLEAFFTESESYADNVETVEVARQALINGYYHVKGYNTALELIGDFYKVPEITVFQMPADVLEDKIKAFNELVPVLHRKIKDTDYGDKRLQAKKLQVLKDFFQPIDYEALTIPEENIKQAKRLFKDFKAFQAGNTGELERLLCTLPQMNGNGEGAY